MREIVLIIHLILAVAMIGIILIQRSEGGGLGIGGGSGGMGSLMSGRSTANLLTKITTILAACFMGTSLILGVMAAQNSTSRSLIDDLQTPAAEAGAVKESAPETQDEITPAPDRTQTEPQPQSQTPSQPEEQQPEVPIAE